MATSADGTRKPVKVSEPRTAGKGKAWDITFAQGPDGDTMAEKAADICRSLCDAGEAADFEFEPRERGQRTYYTITKITRGGNVAYERGGAGTFRQGGGGGGGEPRDETAIMAQIAVKEAGMVVRERVRVVHQRPLVDGEGVVGPIDSATVPSTDDMAKEIAAAAIRIASGMAEAQLLIRAKLSGTPAGQTEPAQPAQAQPVQEPAAGNGNGHGDPEKARLAELWHQAEGRFGGKVKAVKAINAAIDGNKSSSKMTTADLEKALAQA